MNFEVGVKCSNIYFRKENLDSYVEQRLAGGETRLADVVQIRREMTQV